MVLVAVVVVVVVDWFSDGSHGAPLCSTGIDLSKNNPFRLKSARPCGPSSIIYGQVLARLPFGMQQGTPGNGWTADLEASEP